ncbi:hypothetical protein [Thermodesulfovibrio hydrogeniphilus]
MQTTFDKETIEKLMDEFLKNYLPEYIEQYVSEREIKLKEIALVERIVRVEEELKSLRLLEAERHERLYSEMNARFEAINARFEAINARFEALQREMNTRFEALYKEMNTRFEAMNTRFEALEKRLSFQQWLTVAGFSFIAILIAVLNIFVK